MATSDRPKYRITRFAVGDCDCRTNGCPVAIELVIGPPPQIVVHGLDDDLDLAGKIGKWIVGLLNDTDAGVSR